MRYKVSVIVPTLSNKKGVEYLVDYFKGRKEYQLVIIQNAKLKIKNYFTNKIVNFNTKVNGNIVFLPQNKNLGYAGAVNFGARYAKAEWLLLLNDDIKFEIPNFKFQTKKNWLEELVRLAEKYKLDAVAPVLINPDGNVENFGYKVLLIGRVKLIKNLNPKLLSNKNLILDTHIDGLTAACLLIKKGVFEKLGGFDERFFAYLEDVDLFLRMKKSGYRFALTPQIVVFHHHRKTSSKMGCFKEKKDLINWWRLFFKHPDIIRFSSSFLIERLRNFWGLVKCWGKKFGN